MLTYYIVSSLINFIVSAVFGLFIYLKNRKSNIHITFALQCFWVALWSAFYFCWLFFSTTKEEALLWGRLLNTAAIFIPITYFHFVTTFLDIYQRKEKLIFFGYLISLLIFFTSTTPLFVKDVAPELFFPWYSKAGITFHIFTFNFVFFVIYSWYLMFKAIKSTTGIVNLQIKYVLIGTLISFVGGATNFLPVYGIPFPPIGNCLVIIFIIFTAFAIIKYHLFEMTIILTEFLLMIMGVMLLITILIPNFKLTYLLKWLIFFVFCIFAYYLVKTLYEDLKKREKLEKLAMVEKNLRENAEKFKIISLRLKEKLIQTLEIGTIVSQIREVLMDFFKMKNFYFTLIPPDSISKSIKDINNFSNKEINSLLEETNLIYYLQRKKGVIKKDDLFFIPETSNIIENSNHQKERQEIKIIQERLEDNQIEIILPLFQKEKIFGIMFFGKKDNDKDYTKDEIELLEILSSQISIFLQNSLLYEETKNDKEVLERFSKLTIGRELKMIELKERIKELEEKNKKI